MKKLLLLICISCFSLFTGISKEISPYLYGQNYWLADGDENRQGYLHKLWSKVEESGVKMIRIGGNYYNHQFPEDKKLLSMIDSIKNIGAEPLLQVPYNFSFEQTVDLVNYLNKKNTRNIQYWSIGNEPSLEKVKIKIEDVHTYLNSIARAIKSVDPNLRIFIFDECYLTDDYERLCGGDLDMTGKTEDGAWLIDGFSFHSYPNGEMLNRNQTIFNGPAGIRGQVVKLVKLIEAANMKHNRVGNAKLLWALTETNVTYINPDREISGYGNPSFLGGQFMAEIYGIGMEYGAFSINQWCIHESDNVRTDFGYIGAPSDFIFRSSYYHMQMMSRYLKGDFIKSYSNNSYVKTIATSTENEICIMLLNEDDKRDLDFELHSGKTAHAAAPVLVNFMSDLEISYTGTLLNQSTLILIFNKQGELLKRISYSLENNLRNQAPEIINSPGNM